MVEWLKCVHLKEKKEKPYILLPSVRNFKRSHQGHTNHVFSVFCPSNRWAGGGSALVVMILLWIKQLEEAELPFCSPPQANNKPRTKTSSTIDTHPQQDAVKDTFSVWCESEAQQVKREATAIFSGWFMFQSFHWENIAFIIFICNTHFDNIWRVEVNVNILLSYLNDGAHQVLCFCSGTFTRCRNVLNCMCI